MPQSRSYDLDDRSDIDILKLYLKKRQNEFKNKNILIVGSNGLIGKELVRKLKKQKSNIFTIEKKR